MVKGKREIFIDALRETIRSLEEEQRSLLAKNPAVSGSLTQAIEMLKGYLQDCEGVPRIAVLGVTGVGKSTFINHLFGQEIACTNAVLSETKSMEVFGFPPPDGTLFEVCDTRGLGEIGRSAEVKRQLISDLMRNRPHLLAYMFDAGRRDAIDAELAFLRELTDECAGKFGRDSRHMFILNRCDTLSPSGFDKCPGLPWDKPMPGEPPTAESKRKSIAGRLEWFDRQLERAGFSDRAALVPCALEWSDGSKRAWNQESLVRALHAQASPSLLLGFGDTSFLTARLEAIAYEIVERFALIAGAISAASLPISDIALLIPLQFAMVKVVRAFGQKGTLSPEGLFKVVGVVGQGGKMLAGSLLKFLPGIGNLVNASVAGSMTYGLGKLAIDHYLHGFLPEAEYINLLDLGKLFPHK